MNQKKSPAVHEALSSRPSCSKWYKKTCNITAVHVSVTKATTGKWKEQIFVLPFSAIENFYLEVALVMDIISQLQEQVNSIANLAFNTVGTLQRDAPPNRLSPNYPEPPPAPAAGTPSSTCLQSRPQPATNNKEHGTDNNL
ncbi:hypothetical protein KIW84_073658 [Lathyrus oleraceus]|uniref:Mediator of RNA polymerase II transcription subunit 21 n=1 Tax=Pisum sativum TaxID=3888 RepID=A0A9D4VQ48_PEA|nr:hypothetical protein KIW84_073658 [Pisum sativum]